MVLQHANTISSFSSCDFINDKDLNSLSGPATILLIEVLSPHAAKLTSGQPAVTPSMKLPRQGSILPFRVTFDLLDLNLFGDMSARVLVGPRRWWWRSAKHEPSSTFWPDQNGFQKACGYFYSWDYFENLSEAGRRPIFTLQRLSSQEMMNLLRWEALWHVVSDGGEEETLASSPLPPAHDAFLLPFYYFPLSPKLLDVSSLDPRQRCFD